MKIYLIVLGSLALVSWLVFGIGPYLLNSSEWTSWQCGDQATWVSDSFFWEVYYGFGLFGGWEFLLIFGTLCLWQVLSRRLQSSRAVVFLAVLFSLILTLSIILTGNWVRTILLVLE